mgnify:CR=1 FL=1
MYRKIDRYMGNTYYIVAIELSSSKITGVVGIETTEGMRILATASTPVEGFISKGVVRNVDKTSDAINSIINMLESDLRDTAKEDIVFNKARYIKLFFKDSRNRKIFNSFIPLNLGLSSANH